jgi:hypothetical protein
MAVIAAAVGAVMLAGCGGSTLPHPTSLPCNPQPQGALCLKIFKDNGKVTDVVAYLSASDSPLTGKTWRLALTYGDMASFPTRSHHGNPPAETFCKDGQGNTVTTGNGCHDILASEFASAGDFPGFRVPRASIPVPLCLHEQVQQNGKWTAGPAKPACAG